MPLIGKSASKYFSLICGVVVGSALSAWQAKKRYDHKTQSRLKALEDEVKTLRGQIGVLLGNQHAPAFRAPQSQLRYEDRLAEREAENKDYEDGL